MPNEWRIEFYREGNRSPVDEFLSDLDERTYLKFLASFAQLRDRNVLAREPLVRHIEGKVWELREQSQGNIYRIMYFAASGRRFVMLHGFQKKTQKTPRREIATAQERLRRFEEQERRHG